MNSSQLIIKVQSQVVSSNLESYKEKYTELVESMKVDLQTDDDFAEATRNIGELQQYESTIAAVLDQILKGSADLAGLTSDLNEMKAHSREKRLFLNKQVEDQKKQRKAAIVDAAIRNHRSNIEAFIDKNELFEPVFRANELMIDDISRNRFVNASKGKRTIDSVIESLDDEVQIMKDEMSALFDSMVRRAAILDEYNSKSHLFQDRVNLLRMNNEALRSECEKRIAVEKSEALEKAERERKLKEKPAPDQGTVGEPSTPETTPDRPTDQIFADELAKPESDRTPVATINENDETDYHIIIDLFCDKETATTIAKLVNETIGQRDAVSSMRLRSGVCTQ